jgi:pimeloyl-ACP methyl ester carboxylesterase
MTTRKRKVVIRLLMSLVALLTTLHACTFRSTPREIDKFFVFRNKKALQLEYKIGGREIHYVEAGNPSHPLVLFVHGSPGSLSAFIHFLADSVLLDRTLLVTTDRPGFGHSNFGAGEPSLAKQAAALKPILEKYSSNRPRILVGHSLGGPLVAKMAIDYPELVDGLVIVAGSIDPELEPNETWFRAPLATPFLSWVLPRSIRASNEELYHLKPELEEMIPYWKNITCPVILIHGKKDQLVPYENILFAEKMLINAPLRFVTKNNMNHFVPWTDPELIREAIISLISVKKDSLVVVR